MAFKMQSQVDKLSVAESPVRSLQRTMSKMNPETLKSILAARMTNRISPENYQFGSLAAGQQLNYSLPVFHSSTSGFPAESPPGNTAPMTIFYNGMVAVFDVPSDKAEKLIRLAAAGKSLPSGVTGAVTRSTCPGYAAAEEVQMLDGLNHDLPIARRKSLQRFLEKRKGRLTSVTPYGLSSEHSEKNFLEAAHA